MIIYIISGRTTFDRYRRQTTPLPFTKDCPQGYDGKGLLTDFSPQALAELAGISGPAAHADGPTKDLRHLIWSSIDNDDSVIWTSSLLQRLCQKEQSRSLLPSPM